MQSPDHEKLAQSPHVKKRSLWLLAPSLLLITGGIVLVFSSSLKTQYLRLTGKSTNAKLLQSAATSPKPLITQNTSIIGDPKQLKFERLGIDLEVVPGVYDITSDAWTLDEVHAFWASGNSNPISVGDARSHTVIYGHATDAVFGLTRGIAEDELLKVTVGDGTIVTYKYIGESIVTPDTTDIFRQKRTQAITLITCTGPHFEFRRVLNFDLLSVSK
jgi:LPXTG-site transpeptidase (sortase) family protein